MLKKVSKDRMYIWYMQWNWNWYYGILVYVCMDNEIGMDIMVVYGLEFCVSTVWGLGFGMHSPRKELKWEGVWSHTWL